MVDYKGITFRNVVTPSMFLKLVHLLWNVNDSVAVDENSDGVGRVIYNEIFVDNATYQV